MLHFLPVYITCASASMLLIQLFLLCTNATAFCLTQNVLVLLSSVYCAFLSCVYYSSACLSFYLTDMSVFIYVCANTCYIF
jgi:hypothetical protein